MNRQHLSTSFIALMLCACQTIAPPIQDPELIATTQRESVNASPEALLGRGPHQHVFQELKRAPLTLETLRLYNALSRDLARQGHRRAARAISAHTARLVSPLSPEDPRRVAQESTRDTWRWRASWLDLTVCPNPSGPCRALPDLASKVPGALFAPRRSERIRKLTALVEESSDPKHRERLTWIIAQEIDQEPDPSRRMTRWLDTLAGLTNPPSTLLQNIERHARQVTSKELRARAHAALCDHHERRKDTQNALAQCRTALQYDPSSTVITRAVRLEAQFGDLERARTLVLERDWNPASLSLRLDHVDHRSKRLQEIAQIALERGKEAALLRTLGELPLTLENRRFEFQIARNPRMTSALRERLIRKPISPTMWSAEGRLGLELERAQTRITTGEERRPERAWKRLRQRAMRIEDVDARRDLMCAIATFQHQHPATRALSTQTIKRLLSTFSSEPESLYEFPGILKPSYNHADLRGLALSLTQSAGHAPLFKLLLDVIHHPRDRKKLQSWTLQHMKRLPEGDQKAILEVFVRAWSKEVHSNMTISSALLQLSQHPHLTATTFSELFPIILTLEPEHLSPFTNRAWVRRSIARGHEQGPLLLLERLGPRAHRTRLRRVILQEISAFSPGTQRTLEVDLYTWVMVHPRRVSTRLRVLLASRWSRRGDCGRALALLSSRRLARDTLIVSRTLPGLVRTCAQHEPLKAWEMIAVHTSPGTRAALYLELFRSHPTHREEFARISRDRRAK